MKALVGVDTSGSHINTVNLLLRIGFPNLEVHLVHSVQSLMPDGSFPGQMPGSHLAEIYKSMEDGARKAMETTATEVIAHGVSCTTQIEWGDPSRNLIEYADKHSCDLIAVACKTKGCYSSLFFGSVAKGLVTGAKQSLLITKQDHAQEGKVDAVLATDHSPYMSRCISWLENSKPSGLAKVAVLTAYDSNAAEIISAHDPAMAESASLAHSEKTNDEETVRVRKFVDEARSIVRTQSVATAIKNVMRESNAELLIMGAQGHGFFERLMIGSKSFHQVIAEPYSVLVLRPTDV